MSDRLRTLSAWHSQDLNPWLHWTRTAGLTTQPRIFVSITRIILALSEHCSIEPCDFCEGVMDNVLLKVTICIVCAVKKWCFEFKSWQGHADDNPHTKPFNWFDVSAVVPLCSFLRTVVLCPQTESPLELADNTLVVSSQVILWGLPLTSKT